MQPQTVLFLARHVKGRRSIRPYLPLKTAAHYFSCVSYALLIRAAFASHLRTRCNIRATKRSEKGEIGGERAGLRASGNPDRIGRFRRGQVRLGPPRDTSNPAADPGRNFSCKIRTVDDHLTTIPVENLTR